MKKISEIRYEIQIILKNNLRQRGLIPYKFFQLFRNIENNDDTQYKCQGKKNVPKNLRIMYKSSFFILRLLDSEIAASYYNRVVTFLPFVISRQQNLLPEYVFWLHEPTINKKPDYG